ncbi:MAG: hypothetical protein ACLGHN_11630 [Bacteriovoracia bacterium]
MQGELFYGNDGLFNRDDNNASGKPFPAAFSNQEEPEVSEDSKPHLDIKNSNSRLDHYLFHFSSKL